jgi:hypothetical protein
LGKGKYLVEMGKKGNQKGDKIENEKYGHLRD